MLQADSMSDLKDVLLPVMKAIAATIGPRCEVVLHDIQARERLGSTIIAIENGHVTGRSVGGPTTNLGLAALRTDDPNPDRFDYRTQTKDGRVLRSSSVYFRNRSGQLIGALCINVDVMPYMLAEDALQDLVGADAGEVRETFGNDVGEILDGMIQAEIQRLGKPIPLLTREDKLRIVKDLDEKGAFLVKHSVDRVAKALGISRMTAYTYLQKMREEEEATGGS